MKPFFRKALGLIYFIVSIWFAYKLSSWLIDAIIKFIADSPGFFASLLSTGGAVTIGIMAFGIVANVLYWVILIILFSWCFDASKKGFQLVRYKSDKDAYGAYFSGIVASIRDGVRHPVRKMLNRQFAVYSVVFIGISLSIIFVDYSESKSIDKELSQIKVFRDCDSCPQLVIVPAGEFIMGANEEDWKRSHEALPRRKVAVPRPFAVGRYEVTWGEYKQCLLDGYCTYSPHPEPEQDNHPVNRVNYWDAKKYIDWLSKKTRQRYRLPSEAEWEYAARAGTDSNYFWGEKYIPGFSYSKNIENAAELPSVTHVGAYKPNMFGLYDVTGNVNEWVEDCRHNSYKAAPSDSRAWLAESGGDCNFRVYRGGHAGYHHESLAVWARFSIKNNNVTHPRPEKIKYANDGTPIYFNRNFMMGFRIVRDL